MSGRTKGREGREVSGREDHPTCYRFLLEKLPLSHWRPDLSSLNLKSSSHLAHGSKMDSHENTWKEIKEKKLTVGFLHQLARVAMTKYRRLVA